jgi:hypothetical protein
VRHTYLLGWSNLLYNLRPPTGYYHDTVGMGVRDSAQSQGNDLIHRKMHLDTECKSCRSGDNTPLEKPMNSPFRCCLRAVEGMAGELGV